MRSVVNDPVFCFSVEISGLTPDTGYRIVIYSENGVTTEETRQSTVIIVDTEPARKCSPYEQFPIN